MRPDEVLARRIVREIDRELTSIDRLLEEAKQAPGGDDTFTLRGRGSILHDFYTAVERIFVRIAEELNGGVPRGEQWHRQLLDDMALELPGVRPPIISSELAERLGEYLRFRHVFRNVYGFVLESHRLKPLEVRLTAIYDDFYRQIRDFQSWMVGDKPGGSDGRTG